ncbi:ATP-binding protein [Jidongwangia harbinensis]|uniref:ATP-binding protein n=1 Tax=Jidongwangia harbinensis TaxID=2878561 RepID=UPI001CD95838|nr:helix-turn-helix domain-containing protein [Jidongwangia harbinensis]MCA2212775.1 helix-turn-helix domain-containing protein [Jidongwangia harbinensis]
MTSDHRADRSGPGFDAVLRHHRLRANLTQDELAALAHVGVRTVRDLERGRVARPQRTTAGLLADALALTGADRNAFLAAARGQPSTPARPAAAATTPPRYLPLPPATDLIGRDADADELVALLTTPLPAGPRGVTLVGLAGVGKTALALVLSHRIAAAHPGGVAGIVVTEGFTAGEILGTVAAVFGLGRADDLPSRFAGTSGMLLVDAVERSPEAVAEVLSRLLERIPTLRFLATGRHPVGLPAERVWPLAPLVVPPADAPTRPADVVRYPAVELFLDRLARVRRTPPEPEELTASATLVRRLGGMPLAIELAAARGRVLTVPEILDRYGNRVLDLTGRPGDAMVSLRDAVAASYRLLSPPEQYGLRRLAMFRFRWSLALAEQMIGDDADVVLLLDRLLELGLLNVRGNRAFRFRLLDVVRDYATERAAAEGELTAGRRRHALVLADLAEQIAPDLAGANLAEAAARLDVVAGDLGAALTFAATEDPHTALRVATALPRWWRFRGRDVTGRQWLRRLLDDPRTADADPLRRAWAKVGLAQLAREHGAGAEEIASVTTALSDFRRLGTVDGQLTAHTQLAGLWMSTGRYDEARRHGEAALALARDSGRVRDMAVAENNLTWHEIREGNLAAARSRLAAVDRHAARSGEHRLRALAVANLADVERLDGHPEKAILLGRRAIAELEGLGDPNHRRRVLAIVGLALAETGRVAEAAEVLDELRPSSEADVPPDGPAAMVAGAVALRRGEPKQAAESFARAAEAYAGGLDPRDVVAALVGLVISAPDRDVRQDALRRLDEFCEAGGIVLLPRERALLGR